jgi:hypothetical protein
MKSTGWVTKGNSSCTLGYVVNCIENSLQRVAGIGFKVEAVRDSETKTAMYTRVSCEETTWRDAFLLFQKTTNDGVI